MLINPKMNKMDKADIERINKNWEWCQKYWVRKSKQFNLSGWKFEKNSSKTTLGTCNYTRKKILISLYFLRGKSCGEKEMRNTILHEIAHALAGSENGHNEKWKKIAVSIGCDGLVCGFMSRVPGNYEMYCPKGCFKREYHRKPKIDNKVCIKCKTPPLLKLLK